MIPDQHPDPVTEAMYVAARETVQLGALVTGAVRTMMRQRARRARLRLEREERARAVLKARERAEHAAARTKWAPASEPRWLSGAGLVDTATAWCAAVPFADHASPGFDREAAAAVQNCEKRLRDLHPHAMARYDRLRDDGLGHVQAMRATAPLFTRPPRVHDLDVRPLAALAAGDGAGESWSVMIHGPSREEFEAAMRDRRDERGQRIAQRLREDGTLITAEELRARLETSTNLPLDVIAALAPSDTGPARAAGKARNGRPPWRDDFPFPVQAVIAACADKPASPPGEAGDGAARCYGEAERRP